MEKSRAQPEADLGKVVEQIYRDFDPPGPDPSLRRALAELAGRPGAGEVRHQHCLEEFPIREEEVRRSLEPVFRRHGFG